MDQAAAVEALARFEAALAAWEGGLRDSPQAALAQFRVVFRAALQALAKALNQEGFVLAGEDPKDVLKKAFTALWLEDGQLWLDMLATWEGLDSQAPPAIPPHRHGAYFTELHRMAELLKARSSVPPAIHELAARLGRLPKVRRVILFGSRARGDHTERSDVDLAVDAEDEEPRLPAAALVDEAPTLLEIDLVWWPEATSALQQEIAREGITLYARDGIDAE
ncbi:MAG: nucleotidyltransferase domain-containing protein [Candidatus Sericytochromatia bacterium]|nr:nucleotidyltransferase domain-containing protein [Candidatus Sericytochromatia bacterium]